MEENDIRPEEISIEAERDPRSIHIPVLHEEVLSFCHGRNLRRVLDGTIGFGGHAEKILESHPEIELYLGLDQDIEAIESTKRRLQPFASKLILQHVNFIEPLLDDRPSGQFDLILLDIGVSSFQLDTAERGFSFMRDGPLDMRMDQMYGSTSAEEIINRASEKELARIFFEYGEEPKSRMYAKAIFEKRRQEKFRTTLQLAKFIESLSPKRGKLHPATLIFQALRIAVNNEIDVLERALLLYPSLLSASQGQFMVITFHSLEDRIVKQSFQKCAKQIQQEDDTFFQIVTKKPIPATFQESRTNPRARCAKLRILERGVTPLHEEGF
ncbi:MAG: 16S rRNA (cytosine(1402)-N(4))-methyltransferase RsmH [Chlamydia sp.]